MLVNLHGGIIDERLQQLDQTIKTMKVPASLGDVEILLQARECVKNCKGCDGHKTLIIHAIEMATIVLYKEVLEKEKFERAMG